MAILAFVAFVSMVFPEVTHATTSPSSTEFLFPKHFLSLFSPVFSSSSLNTSLAVYELATAYILSKTPSNKSLNNPDKKDPKKSKDTNLNENSTSKKKPKGKD